MSDDKGRIGDPWTPQEMRDKGIALGKQADTLRVGGERDSLAVISIMFTLAAEVVDRLDVLTEEVRELRQ